MTLCHETIYWAGHKSWLDRVLVGISRADDAREALIAEIGSGFLEARIEIEPTIEEGASQFSAFFDCFIEAVKEEV